MKYLINKTKMSLQDNIKKLNINLVDIISTNEISYLKNTDKKN
jgi:hypothetical protein